MVTPPHDLVAEHAVLGCCILNPAVVAELNLSAGDFYEPRNALVWTAVTTLTSKGVMCDLPAVHGWLFDRGDLDKAGGFGYLSGLTDGLVVTVNADYHAHIVKDHAGRRALLVELERSIQDVYESDDGCETLTLRAEARLARVSSEAVADLLNLDEFLDQAVPEDEWVIPDLMTRGDRLILTGAEGLGKSIVMRQMAVCAAAGFHPFNGAYCSPMNVLLVDVENPTRIMIKTLDRMRSAAVRHGRPANPNRMWIRRRPEGINLADPAERLWLKREAQTVNADLLCIGPAYKLSFGGRGEREEDIARNVTIALDMVRESVGCAVVLEHHAPHQESGSKVRNVRPIGSSLWLRWPEFGLGIRLADEPDAFRRRLVDVVPWRVGRDERPWPERLQSANDGMPWIEAEPPSRRVA